MHLAVDKEDLAMVACPESHAPVDGQSRGAWRGSLVDVRRSGNVTVSSKLSSNCDGKKKQPGRRRGRSVVAQAASSVPLARPSCGPVPVASTVFARECWVDQGRSGRSNPMATKVKPIPDGYHAVTPYLCVAGAAEALDFYKRAFGASEIMRNTRPGR